MNISLLQTNIIFVSIILTVPFHIQIVNNFENTNNVTLLRNNSSLFQKEENDEI